MTPNKGAAQALPMPTATFGGTSEAGSRSRHSTPHRSTYIAWRNVESSLVYQWRCAWRAGGMAALASTGPGGVSCRLSPGQLARLGSELDRGPAAHVFEGEAGQTLRPPKARTWSR